MTDYKVPGQSRQNGDTVTSLKCYVQRPFSNLCFCIEVDGGGDHWAGAGGSGGHLGEAAVVTTTVETDFGEPAATCCCSCCVWTVWMRT